MTLRGWLGKGRREKEEGRERGPDDWAQSCTLFVCLAWGRGGGRDLPRLNLGVFAFFSCLNLCCMYAMLSPSFFLPNICEK